MISMIRGAAVAFALLLFAVPASADSYLDFGGPPQFGVTSTSNFVGDWDSKNGTLTIDDALVTALEYDDPSEPDQSLFNKYLELINTGTVTVNDDAALGANVDITATFIDGHLDTSATNTITIYDASTTYFHATLSDGMIVPGDTSEAFRITLTSFGGDIVDDSVSDWFIENNLALTTSGVFAFNFDGKYTDAVAGTGADGITNLNNLNGKLTPTPEPGTLALLGVAAVGFVAVRRRRKAAA